MVQATVGRVWWNHTIQFPGDDSALDDTNGARHRKHTCFEAFRGEKNVLLACRISHNPQVDPGAPEIITNLAVEAGVPAGNSYLV